MVEIAGAEQTVALLTYSSVLRAGVEGPLPSSLSVLALLGARHQLDTARSSGELLLAAEQSYKDCTSTTGDLLLQHAAHHFPERFTPKILRSNENQLINTVYQVEALADYCRTNEVDRLHIFGWKFHGWRTLRLFDAHAPELEVAFKPIEPGLEAMDQAALQAELRALGIEVGLHKILNRGLRMYQLREFATSATLLVSPDGRLLNWASARRENKGRSDDLTTKGWQKWDTTNRVWTGAPDLTSAANHEDIGLVD